MTVNVSAETVTTDISFSLTVGGIIRETVRDTKDLTPIENIDINLTK